MNQPKQIYLQIGEDTILESESDFKELEVTWCTEKINENDIKYISETYVNELIQEKDKTIASLQKQIEELKASNDKLHFGDAMTNIRLYEHECDNSLYKSTLEALVPEFNDNIENLMDGCRLTGMVEVVKEQDVIDKNYEDEDFGIYKDIRVDQWSVGDSGDSFAGFIYTKVNNIWLKIPYDC